MHTYCGHVYTRCACTCEYWAHFHVIEKQNGKCCHKRVRLTIQLVFPNCSYTARQRILWHLLHVRLSHVLHWWVFNLFPTLTSIQLVSTKIDIKLVKETVCNLCAICAYASYQRIFKLSPYAERLVKIYMFSALWSVQLISKYKNMACQRGCVSFTGTLRLSIRRKWCAAVRYQLQMAYQRGWALNILAWWIGLGGLPHPPPLSDSLSHC